MDSNIASLLIEYGSLGIFVVFVIYMTKEMRETSKAREDRWTETLKQLADSNDRLSKQIAYNTAMIIKHDAWSRGKLGNGNDSDVHELANILLEREEGPAKR